MEDLYCWQLKFESCYYTERLINKIVLLNKKSNYKVDLNQIRKAIYYAKKYQCARESLTELTGESPVIEGGVSSTM